MNTLRKRIGRMFWLGLCLALTVAMFVTWFSARSLNGNDCARLVDMVYGRACKPFVYRTLVPSMVRVTTSLMPSSLKAFLERTLAQQPWVQSVFASLHWEPAFFIEYGVALTFTYASMLGFFASLLLLFDSVLTTAKYWLKYAAVAAALLALRYLIRHVSYVYDLPTLFLFTLGLALLAQRKWRWFLLVYLIGCLNKETTVLLTLVYVIHYYDESRMQRPRFLRLLMWQIGIFLVIRFALMAVYRGSPGDPIEFHLLDNNWRLIRRFFLQPSFAAEGPWLGVGLLVAYRWSTKPAFLRSAIWILAPILAAMPLFGQLDELRVYYEVLPIAVLLLAHSVASLLGIPLANVELPPLTDEG